VEKYVFYVFILFMVVILSAAVILAGLIPLVIGGMIRMLGG